LSNTQSRALGGPTVVADAIAEGFVFLRVCWGQGRKAEDHARSSSSSTPHDGGQRCVEETMAAPKAE